MKKLSLALVTSAIMLSGCALWPSAFDGNEHRVLTNLVVASSNKAICQDVEATGYRVQELADDVEWLRVYGASLPDNEKLSDSYVKLSDIVNGMKKRYDDKSKDDPSRVYCETKLDSINKASKTLLDVSGRRPRL